MYKMEQEVHLSDTDVTGQVYYARPLEWMEWCRVNWFQEKYGNFMKRVEETGITFFPSKINVDYKKPMMFGDKLTVEMCAKEIKKVSFVLDYAVKRGEETVLTADVVMVCFDNSNKKLGKIDPDMLAYIQGIG
ncbi:MAG: acyl-CoA thioesterase [Candidatus Goldbacteria bacterium]|nr:acyl-CoA thioesterase [Candidatus Goldiibacteriota bacterium]